MKIINCLKKLSVLIFVLFFLLNSCQEVKDTSDNEPVENEITEIKISENKEKTDDKKIIISPLPNNKTSKISETNKKFENPNPIKIDENTKIKEQIKKANKYFTAFSLANINRIIKNADDKNIECKELKQKFNEKCRLIIENVLDKNKFFAGKTDSTEFNKLQKIDIYNKNIKNKIVNAEKEIQKLKKDKIRVDYINSEYKKFEKHVEDSASKISDYVVIAELTALTLEVYTELSTNINKFKKDEITINNAISKINNVIKSRKYPYEFPENK